MNVFWGIFMTSFLLVFLVLIMQLIFFKVVPKGTVPFYTENHLAVILNISILDFNLVSSLTYFKPTNVDEANILLSKMNTAKFEKLSPISSLPYLYKFIEKVIAIYLVEHMRQNGIMGKFQSAYKAHHSTETALLRV